MSYGPFDLTGRVALVTGGNAGIGLGMAEALAQAGADVAIWGTNEARNGAAAARLERTGRRVLALACDVGDAQAVEAAFARTLEAFGRVDGCFANAGVASAHAGGFETMTDEEWQRVQRINVDGVFHTFRAAARYMMGREGGGALVVTSSMAAIHGAARNEQYAASKGAVISMIRALAVEYARYGVRAHAILPGWVETAMTERKFADPKFQQYVKTRIPMRRWGEPEDFGGIAIYLMSDASRWHTGDCFVIDGGYTIF